jgi:hypothetical protein
MPGNRASFLVYLQLKYTSFCFNDFSIGFWKCSECVFFSLYHYKGSLYAVKIEKDVRCITTVQPFLIFEDGKGMKKREYY